MRNKIPEMLSLTRNVRKQSVAMQHKLLLYWISMLLAVFAALLVVLSAMGVFSGTGERLHQVLSVHHKNVAATLKEQINLLTARGIDLSEQVSDGLDTLLYAKPTAELNNDAQSLKELEEAFYPKLNTALRSSPCNGVYLVMDATINTEAEGAEASRAGLYLRFANLNAKNAVHQDVVLFRGIADIARMNQVELHNRWKMEFDTSLMIGYTQALEQEAKKLTESVFWTPRVRLTDTWENILLLVVPIPGSDGSYRGICGVELGELYMQLSYPAQESEFGNMMTVIAPMEEDRLLLSQGLTGGQGGANLTAVDTLTVEEGRLCHRYTGEDGTFLGMHTKLDMEVVDGSSMYAVTLFPEDTYRTVRDSDRLRWIAASTMFLVATILLAVCLSRRFVRPITQSLDALNSDTETEVGHTGISEIDTLVAFLRTKGQSGGTASLPADIEELFNAFAGRAGELTTTERNIIKYYAEGREVAEVAELAFISIHTVRKHNLNIYRKLGVSSREEVMLYLELFRRCGRLDEIFREKETE
ncbi:MAG: helix-turn-helix transcriptional regulator [Lachnospiraceae bacterium]|nr:helix-turn-helix transcriptional regulator [Lachnospiraceae bacterium]